MHKKAANLLPAYMMPLVSPYTLVAYWFEIAECMRKVALVGVPTLFYQGSIEQVRFFPLHLSSCGTTGKASKHRAYCPYAVGATWSIHRSRLVWSLLRGTGLVFGHAIELRQLAA